MLSLRRIGLYTATSLAAVLAHTIFRLALQETATRWALCLATLYAFKVLEQRKRIGLKDKHSYYVPLGVTLLLMGEAADAINDTMSHEPNETMMLHRCAVHGSLAFSIVAECEWWRDFVRSHTPHSPTSNLSSDGHRTHE
jgi:hypothetical protein